MKKITNLLLARAKTLFALALLCLIASTAMAQVAIDATNFPDENFRAWVQANYDDGNGYLDQAKAATLTEFSHKTYRYFNNLLVNHNGLEDFTGLEYFKNIHKIGDLGSNLKNNYWGTKLPKLSSFPLLDSLIIMSPTLSSLDVSDCTSIKYINCDSGNLNGGNLTEVNLNNATNLEYCSLNRYSNIATVNLLNNNSLQTLYLWKTSITSLDLSQVPNLKDLVITSTTTINVWDIDFSKTPNLESLYCTNNNISNLDFLQNLPNLKQLICGQNNISSIDLSLVPLLTHLNIDDNSLTELDLSPVLGLESLSVSQNNLTSLDVSQLSNLNELYCNGNQISSLSVVNKPFFESLTCSYNSIISLELKNLPNLWFLECDNNELTFIDLTTCPHIGDTYYDNNHLTSLDFSNNPEAFANGPGIDGNYATITPYRKEIDGETAYILYLNANDAGGRKTINNMIHEIEGENVNDDIRFDANRVTEWVSGCEVVGNLLLLDGPTGTLTYKYDSHSPDNNYSEPLLFTLKWESSQPDVLRGDANGDGEVNVLDVVAAANYVMKMNPEPFVFDNADVNGDGKVNITDVIGIANITLEE